MAEDDASHIIHLQVVWQVYRVPIILGLLSLFFVALSITIFIKSYQPETPIMFSSDVTEASVAGAARVNNTAIVADIEGAVVHPGVYRLPQGSRIDDLLRAAGGFAPDVDTEAVAQSINRAAIVSDGAKIYIPGRGEHEALRDAGTSATVTPFVNINAASQAELESLIGIGAVTATKIISGRPYMRLEELVEKKAMGQSLFDKLKEQLTL